MNANARPLRSVPDYLTLSQAAELVQCNSETLRRAIRDRRLSAGKVGRHWRIRRADLDAWMYGDGRGK